MVAHDTKKSMSFICLDTCSIVDCVYSRRAKSNPNLLDKILERCKREGVKLLIPEVVLLELDVALRKQMENANEGLKSIKASIDQAEKSGVLNRDICKSLRVAVKHEREGIEKQVDEELESIRAIACDENAAEVIPLTVDAIVEATRMGIAGKKPSSSKGSHGLLQGDCLIVAALERFMSDHAGDLLYFCSSNVSDFAVVTDGEESLHPDIAERLRGTTYYANPVDLFNSPLPSRDEREGVEAEEYAQSYKLVRAEREASLQQNLKCIAESMQEVLAKYEPPAARIADLVPALTQLSGHMKDMEYPGNAELMERNSDLLASATRDSLSKTGTMLVLKSMADAFQSCVGEGHLSAADDAHGDSLEPDVRFVTGVSNELDGQNAQLR